jgi:geranylgeranyl diphosphate synthase type II
MSNGFETALENAVARAATGSPKKLAEALRYAVFPGGARIRPRLCVAVARACGAPSSRAAEAAAAAIELVHCASLVHDDLPCFDDATERRGRAAVHRAFGEPIAVLVGDGLIVLSFETLAVECAQDPSALVQLVPLLARAVGAPNGLVAGQAWESEPSAPLAAYHRAKTGSLFVAATTAGAIAAGQAPGPWRTLGERLGEAYQVADDLLDAVAGAAEAGKSTQRDHALGRPNAVDALGLTAAVARLRALVQDAVDSIPPCEGRAELAALVVAMAERLVPASLRQSAA